MYKADFLLVVFDATDFLSDPIRVIFRLVSAILAYFACLLPLKMIGGGGLGVVDG